VSNLPTFGAAKILDDYANFDGKEELFAYNLCRNDLPMRRIDIPPELH
jgi:hypothetical protein